MTDTRNQEGKNLSIEEALCRVRTALEGMRYGEVVVKVVGGRVVWVDKSSNQPVG